MPGVTAEVESYYRSILDRSKSGTRLPSERSVVNELHTCRSTIRLVLTKLIAEKLITPEHGRGYFKA